MSPELRTLVETAFEGCLDAEQLARLNVLLESDPAACLAYVQYVTMIAGVRRCLTDLPSLEVEGEETEEQVTLRFANRRVPFERDCPSTAEAKQFSADLAEDINMSRRNGHPQKRLRKPSVNGTGTNDNRTRRFRVWSYVVTAGLAAVVAAMGTVLLSGRSSAPTVAGDAPDGVAAVEERLILSAPSKSSSGNTGINSLQLQSGTAEFWIANVGWVVAEGPVNFELLSPMRARLNQGRIRVRVTQPSGYGFVVETPDGAITDLGTEFGVSVNQGERSSLLVFEGEVDLNVKLDRAASQRLVGGEGLAFAPHKQSRRITSIFTGRVPTFRHTGEALPHGELPLITDVTDNLTDSRRFYEILPGGLREDTLAYVDRPNHNWNGVTTVGMPSYLVGADYVKTFCDDKRSGDREIYVTLSAPAVLYVFFDDTVVETPKWLKEGFRYMGDRIGLDLGPNPPFAGGWPSDEGPGRSIEKAMAVWSRTVPQAGSITLGYGGQTRFASMYGIAAVPLKMDK
ncbi:MAG: FecR domain-containing protein [Pirellulales bacterium]